MQEKKDGPAWEADRQRKKTSMNLGGLHREESESLVSLYEDYITAWDLEARCCPNLLVIVSVFLRLNRRDT